MSSPLAVVIASYNSHSTLRRALESLTRQPEVVEIVVSDGSPQDPAELLSEDFPTVRFVHFADAKTLPALRWSGVALTAAPLVAALEATCVPAPDWARWMATAHDAASQAPVVGGAVTVRPGAGAFELGLYFCEYAPFAPPVEEGPAAALSGANLCYKRSALEYLDSGCWETAMHERWLIEGRELRLCPAAVEFCNAMRPGAALRQRFHYGRAYAAERWGANSLLCAALCPLLPGVLTWRQARWAWRKGMTRRFARALGWTLALNLAWSAGELRGYLAGPDPKPRIF